MSKKGRVLARREREGGRVFAVLKADSESCGLEEPVCCDWRCGSRASSLSLARCWLLSAHVADIADLASCISLLLWLPASAFLADTSFTLRLDFLFAGMTNERLGC